jgi:hypothetical protein
MTTRTAGLVGLSVLGFALSLFAAASQPAQVTSTERVDFAPGGLIRLNTATGNLFVDGWDRPEIEITTTKSTRRAYQPGRQDEAVRCLESIRVTTERRSGAEVALTVVVPPRGFFNKLFGLGCGVTVDHRIQVPRDSRLVIRHEAGYVLVSHVTGEIEVTSRSSDLMLMLPGPGPYSIDAKSKFGSVASDFAGVSQRTKLFGEQFAGANPAPARRIYLRIGFGGITVKEVPPTPEAPVPADDPRR